MYLLRNIAACYVKRTRKLLKFVMLEPDILGIQYLYRVGKTVISFCCESVWLLLVNITDIIETTFFFNICFEIT